MKNFLGLIKALLCIEAFAKNEEGKKILADEQKAQVKETYGEEMFAKIEAGLAEDADETETNDATVINSQNYIGSISALTEKLIALEKEKSELAANKSALETEKTANATKIANLTNLIGQLSAKDENDPEKRKGNETQTLDAMNDKFLFGVEKPFMAIDSKHPYNQRAYAAIAAANGQMVVLPKASSMDYTSLAADLGDYYRIKKQERIQSFLIELPSLESIFPLQSGFQDKAVLVNLFLEGEFSQADNSTSTFDNVVKGGFKFEPEELQMYSVMFSHTFSGLKELEKQWIGYLNKEGSSSMKWSFIEFILVEAGKKLHNERENRRINGKRINPVLNTPGTANGASTGARHYINAQISALKMKAFENLGEWNDSNIVDILKGGTALIPAAWRDTGKIKCYIATEGVTAYDAKIRQLNGMNTDYTGKIRTVLDYDNVEIIGVPNWGPSKRIIWTLEGNLNLYEDVPGEMYDFQLEQKDWSLKVWSQWKEGFCANIVGKKMATAADFPEDYSSQLIWCNNADLGVGTYIPMAKDDTTPSVADHKSLVSVGNTSTVTITDIDDANVGDEIHLKAGSTTNGIALAASGKFSLLTAAWNPVKGEEIWLKKRSDGKFIELKRISASTSAVAFSANDTTPSVSGADTFITDANTTATAITTFDDAVTAKVYTIYGAGSTNASTIANSGNFVLTAAMTLSAGA